MQTSTSSQTSGVATNTSHQATASSTLAPMIDISVLDKKESSAESGTMIFGTSIAATLVVVMGLAVLLFCFLKSLKKRQKERSRVPTAASLPKEDVVLPGNNVQFNEAPV
jgi:hypothetical protein